jgi:asparagine synthase (glutamine-hydrolysing)
MCGLAAVIDSTTSLRDAQRMIATLAHRGPDGAGAIANPEGSTALSHRRLAIIDRSSAGAQPMVSADGRYTIVFNGEVYNYRELRAELRPTVFGSQTDTEVILAAYRRWGAACLHRFTGMFAFAIWDEDERTLFAARDRFGVKPLYYAQRPDGGVVVGSEIKALHAAGIPAEPDPVAWATYFVSGLTDHSQRTFWRHINAVPAGHTLTVHEGQVTVRRWYDFVTAAMDLDVRSEADVIEHYVALLRNSVRLRFRADVPVGINLSGGLDSSTLLGVVDSLDDDTRRVRAFTFITGDDAYDELPWVRRMLAGRRHPLIVCPLRAVEVPALAAAVQAASDEPFGGIPTLAYARLFEVARAEGVPVLLDGQGMDEQWAGYSYYADDASAGKPAIIQGSRDAALRPECLAPEFAALAEPPEPVAPFGDRLRDLQFRDLFVTKIPRALRYNDRASMRASTELREPFLDHRLVELAVRQRADRKLRQGQHKWMLRQIASTLLPLSVVSAPKRPVQTPQREWLRGELRDWSSCQILLALEAEPAWFNRTALADAWSSYCAGAHDNSFFVWQWISLGLSHDARGVRCGSV